MSVLLFLILASLALAVAALVGFVWAVKTGQFDDTCTPSMRLLLEETESRTATLSSRSDEPKIVSLNYQSPEGTAETKSNL
jgi:cbb3-type cytochrome oxidase maturation protein